ncbi:MAG: hypothetical protein RLP44_10225 [Aggregatilineales bacterium]
MTTDLRNQAHTLLDNLADNRLDMIVRWLQLLKDTEGETDVEPEEMWLLANGELKRMAGESEMDATSIEDWRKYLDEI